MSAQKNFMEHLGPSSALEPVVKERKDQRIASETVRKNLDYCEETGVFRWLLPSKYHSEKKGSVAGSEKNGYIKIQLLGSSYMAHRLAWIYVFGYEPFVIDHINGNKSDNRICNLRNVAFIQNNQNHLKASKKTTGLPVGVKKLKSGMYQARASALGKCYALGSYKTKEEAHERYRQFAARNHDNPAV